MRTVPALISTALLATIWIQVATAGQEHASKYSGQEKRTIKSLSPDDIAELKRGGGWGLAKAAELNGLPGPAHLLELKDDIGLSVNQTQEIQALYNEMNKQAIEYGKRLISQELQLERRFQSDPPSAGDLTTMLTAIERTRTKLRFIHLATHLKTPLILSKQQVATYNKLRGYTANSPCENIPKGHDEAMWRKHNSCN